MANLRFTKDHEWISVDGDVGTIGISNYAQTQLGDVVFVELPERGRELTKGQQAAVVESVKAASEVYAPVSGEVIDTNAELEAMPANVNEDAQGKGWFMKVRVSDASEISDLMSEADYQAYLETLS